MVAAIGVVVIVVSVVVAVATVVADVGVMSTVVVTVVVTMVVDVVTACVDDDVTAAGVVVVGADADVADDFSVAADDGVNAPVVEADEAVDVIGDVIGDVT